MPVFRLIGCDRETGEDRTLVIEKDTERQAADAAYADGLVLQKIQEVRVAKSRNPRTIPAESRVPMTRKAVSWLRITDLNWRSAYNRQVSIIAMGVMVGMFLFTCMSSLFVYCIAQLGRWLSGGLDAFQ